MAKHLRRHEWTGPEPARRAKDDEKRAIQIPDETASIIIQRVLIGSGGFVPGPGLQIDFTIANPGLPSTFYDWKLWVRAENGQSAEFAPLMMGEFGVETTPLQSGERRPISFQLVSLRLDVPAFRQAGTVFTLQARDVREREIRAQFVLRAP